MKDRDEPDHPVADALLDAARQAHGGATLVVFRPISQPVVGNGPNADDAHRCGP